MVKKIILVFKTHFDIGFTDLAENVIQSYGGDMLRQVIETCRATEHLGALRYVWTMPAWPLWHITERCEPELKPELERLIQNGQIVWHALPFTSHTDFCAPEEYVQGLQYARKLSEKYGKPYAVAGKMTDVPGHGLMLPELLDQAGIRFLHLGCNEFATPPDVPRLFFWQSPNGGRVLTMYSKGGYGTTLLPPEDWPFPVWMALMHTHDNCGPQSAEMILGLAGKAKEAYPGAEIVCGTMDDFYYELSGYDLSGVPVVTRDLADTWIHGVGSYPAEVSQMRENRERARALHRAYYERLTGGGKEIPGLQSLWERYYEQVALFEEHTWGADVKTWLGPNRVYEKDEFTIARATEPYRFMERSWDEQRRRTEESTALLDEIAEKLPLPETPPETASAIRISGTGVVESDRYRLTFDAAAGRIDEVFDKRLGAALLKSRDGRGVFSYQYDRYGFDDINEFLRNYGYHFTTWGIQDYGRENYPLCGHKSYAPLFDRYEIREDRVVFHYHTGESAEKYGDCRGLALTVRFAGEELEIELVLEDKQATPYVESGSLIFPLAEESAYRVGRPCARIDPETQIADCANHALYCVETDVTAQSVHGSLTIRPKDTPLFGIGSPGVYEYHKKFPQGRSPELWFDLFNNMWGTNFPQWIEGSFRCRWTLRGGISEHTGAAMPGIPDGMELVHTRSEGGTLYLLLRDWSGSAGQRTLRLEGAELCRTDLLRRPLGPIARDELDFDVRPNGLHCFSVKRYDRGYEE